MEQIRKYFETLVTLTDNDWYIFSSKLIRQEFPKKSLLLKAGQTENYLSFVEKGIIRFYIPKKESEVTFDFVFQDTFVSGYSSFLTQTPSIFHIEALTDTILWRLTYDDLQRIYTDTNVGNTIGRYASEGLFLEKAKRELSFLNESAEQRYLKLFKEQPHLIKQIPLKYLSSYIGITPQALSRIRRRVT